MASVLPEGVTLLPDDARLSDVSQLPFLSVIYDHTAPQVDEAYKGPLVKAIDAEYRRAKELYRDDFSCGCAVRDIVGMRYEYLPADYDTKISNHLVEYVKTLPDEYFREGMGGPTTWGYRNELIANRLTQLICEKTYEAYMKDLGQKSLRGRFVYRHKGKVRKGRRPLTQPWYYGTRPTA